MSALKLKKGSTSHSAYNLRPNFSDLQETHTLAVLVDNESGVLARVIGLFSGRGYNIESLTVAEVDTCLLYTSPSPRDGLLSRMPSSA